MNPRTSASLSMPPISHGLAALAAGGVRAMDPLTRASGAMVASRLLTYDTGPCTTAPLLEHQVGNACVYRAADGRAHSQRVSLDPNVASHWRQQIDRIAAGEYVTPALPGPFTNRIDPARRASQPTGAETVNWLPARRTLPSTGR
jgi:hypothetical protein